MHKTLPYFKSNLQHLVYALALCITFTASLQAGKNGWIEIEFDSNLKVPASSSAEASTSTSSVVKRAEDFTFTSTIMGQMGNVERPVQVNGLLSKIRASFLIGDHDPITTYDTYEAAKKLFVHVATLYSRNDVQVPGSFETPPPAPAIPAKTFSQEMIETAKTIIIGTENLMAALVIKKYFKCSLNDARALLRIINPQVPPAQAVTEDAQALPEEIAAPFHCVITGELALAAIDSNDDQYYSGEIKPICLQHFTFTPEKASDVYRIHISLDGVVPSLRPTAYLDILTTAQVFGVGGNLLQQQSNRGLKIASSLPASLKTALPFLQASTWVKFAFVNRTSKNTPDNPFAFMVGDFNVSDFWISFFLGDPPQPFSSTKAFEAYQNDVPGVRDMVHVPLSQETDIQISLVKEAKVQWHQLFTARFKNADGSIDRRMLISDTIVEPFRLDPIQSVTTELFAAVPPTVKGRLFDLVTQTFKRGTHKSLDPKMGATIERPATFIIRSHAGDEYIPLYLSTSKTNADKQDDEEKEDI